jgi:DNA repair protein RecN (Recombination protein N)
MITELSIRNFAIIDEMKISFAEGLNVITGETGAGKSILIGAMSLLLGERASVDIIRSHEDSAMVEAFFEIEGMNDLKEMLKEMGFHVGNELILKRIISRTGKNRVFVDGQLATLGMLSAISTTLVNICGQHEHQIILNAEKHIDILDNFGDLEQLRSEYTELYNQYLALSGKLRQLLEVNKTREERGEFLRFHLKEIEDAGIRIGEDDQLQEEKRVLNNVQKLLEYADVAHDVLYGKSGSVLEGLRSINSNVREIKKIDRTLSLSEKDLDAVYYQLEEAALALRNYKKNLSYDPTRLEAIDDRLELLSRLKRKYGRTLEDVLQKKTEIEQELKTIDSVDEEIDLLLAEVEDLKANMVGKAQMLSARRREIAALLKKEIEEEIHALRMEKATFEVMFTEATSDQGGLPFHSRGVDQVEFYLTTNVGEVPKPLNRIASGGELSRIMLAMKKVLAGTGSVGTLVFDEVDSGIGGATAEDVGRKLSDVSKDHQVLCITHLPQIACFGDRHYRVSKTVVGEKTVTSVGILSEDERLDEITRMLGGTELTEKTREHAREMLVMSRVKK